MTMQKKYKVTVTYNRTVEEKVVVWAAHEGLAQSEAEAVVAQRQIYERHGYFDLRAKENVELVTE